MPLAVGMFVSDGQEVIVESGAGAGFGIRTLRMLGFKSALDHSLLDHDERDGERKKSSILDQSDNCRLRPGYV